LNYLFILKKKNIKSILIDATFPSILKKKFIFKKIFLNGYYKTVFNLLNDIYCISENDYSCFSEFNINSNLHKSCDTRNDRIMVNVLEAKKNPIISRELFNDEEIILVAGSV